MVASSIQCVAGPEQPFWPKGLFRMDTDDLWVRILVRPGRPVLVSPVLRQSYRPLTDC